MYETADFSAVDTHTRLYLSVTHRTRAERVAMFESFEVAPPTCVLQCKNAPRARAAPQQRWALRVLPARGSRAASSCAGKRAPAFIPPPPPTPPLPQPRGHSARRQPRVLVHLPP